MSQVFKCDRCLKDVSRDYARQNASDWVQINIDFVMDGNVVGHTENHGHLHLCPGCFRTLKSFLENAIG